jgi:hypothetical protein
MEKITNKIWRAWLGFEPCLEQKKLFIEESLRDKISLEQVCSNYQMPELFIIGHNDRSEPVEFLGEKITIAEIEKRFPHKKIVIITTRK